MIKFSVIIPTCNRNSLLAMCLDKLAPNSQSLPSSLYEVIVTDDGKDNNAKLLIESEYQWANWTAGLKKGPAANRNNGATIAKGKWLVFLDDDCQPDCNLLKEYDEGCRLSAALVFEGRISPDRQRQRLDEESPVNEVGGLLWSCNFMIQRTFFWSIGGFSDLFQYASMEDVDLRERVLKQTSLVFLPRAFVIHPWRKVGNPISKFSMAYHSHKVFLGLHFPHPRFTPSYLFKNLLISFFKSSLPDLIKYRGKGYNYCIHYHIFQLKFLIYVLSKSRKTGLIQDKRQ